MTERESPIPKEQRQTQIIVAPKIMEGETADRQVVTVKVPRAEAYAVCAWVVATVKSGSLDKIEDWHLAIAELVEGRYMNRTPLAELARRHNERVDRYLASEARRAERRDKFNAFIGHVLGGGRKSDSL